jgi:hypothetical protein
VTLDLNGFTIASTAASASGYGIRINSELQDITIQHGKIRGGVTNSAGTYGGPGFLYGIYYSGTAPVNTRVTGVSVSGCLYHGIYLYSGIYPGLGDSTVVESCAVRTVGSSGIAATVIKGSVAMDCGATAIYGSAVSDCRGESVNSDGIFADTAQNCFGYAEGSGIGLSATTALNCQGTTTYGTYGLFATTAMNCKGYSYGSGTYGLFTATAQNCYGNGGGSGTGLRANDVAIGSTGFSQSGVGLSAYIANSCRVLNGTASITNKYNMP